MTVRDQNNNNCHAAVNILSLLRRRTPFPRRSDEKTKRPATATTTAGFSDAQHFSTARPANRYRFNNNNNIQKVGRNLYGDAYIIIDVIFPRPLAILVNILF